jgi:hypothetical protein
VTPLVAWWAPKKAAGCGFGVGDQRRFVVVVVVFLGKM